MIRFYSRCGFQLAHHSWVSNWYRWRVHRRIQDTVKGGTHWSEKYDDQKKVFVKISHHRYSILILICRSQSILGDCMVADNRLFFCHYDHVWRDNRAIMFASSVLLSLSRTQLCQFGEILPVLDTLRLFHVLSSTEFLPSDWMADIHKILCQYF